MTSPDLDRAKTSSKSSERLFDALTHLEIVNLIDALLAVMPPELQATAIAQLSPDTQKTIQQLLMPSPDPEPESTTPKMPTVSLAKQAQQWSQLWQQWHQIVAEAAEEDGEYIVQEVEWEPPYFDNNTFTEDLEKLAHQMLPLLPIAFEHQFFPEGDFVAALLEAEADVMAGIPDWIGIIDGLPIEPQLTRCILQWEWLCIQAEEKDAFEFVQRLRQYEEQFQEVQLNVDTVIDFVCDLSVADRQNILTGLTIDEDNDLWKKSLDSVHNHWHRIRLYFIQQYAPDNYLKSLEKTIPQQWQNGLPIIESLLAENNNAKSLKMIEKTLQSLLAAQRIPSGWIPEDTLLIAVASSYSASGIDDRVTTLLRYYQQTAAALNQMERAQALAIQQIAIAEWFNWSKMFDAFSKIAVSAATRQSLFVSWRDYVDRRSRPYTASYHGQPKTPDTWWVPWLIDSIMDTQKGSSWFQQQITTWIANLAKPEINRGADYNLLRLLTRDLTEIERQGKSSHPHFYRVVIRPQEFSMHNDSDLSRREYLQKMAPEDLWARVMNYWTLNLQYLVPSPESATKSDYTSHAKWMQALQEISPQDYKMLLAQWRVLHHRRSNLWKAMAAVGLT